MVNLLAVLRVFEMVSRLKVTMKKGTIVGINFL